MRLCTYETRRRGLGCGGERRLLTPPLMAALLGSGVSAATGMGAYRVSPDHPQIFVTRAGLPELARRCAGPLAEDCRAVKGAADAAVAHGRIPELADRWHVPADLMNCGLAYLVEREAGQPCRQYADLIRTVWGDGGIIANPEGSAFGYHALAYDWIYDALSPEERQRYGRALGTWLRFYTHVAAVLYGGAGDLAGVRLLGVEPDLRTKKGEVVPAVP
jgi:hypothetical protein